MEREVVERQLLEPIRPRVEIFYRLLQVHCRELLELHLGQTNVLHLEAAPQSVDALEFNHLATALFSASKK